MQISPQPPPALKISDDCSYKFSQENAEHLQLHLQYRLDSRVQICPYLPLLHTIFGSHKEHKQEEELSSAIMPTAKQASYSMS